MTTLSSLPVRNPATIGFAEDLFRPRTNCFTAVLVTAAIKLKLPPAPDQPFTEEELVAACSRDEQLIWFPSVDAKGAPITMKRFYESFGEAPLGGKLLYDTDWYQNEDFFAKQTARTDKSKFGQWRLVGQQAVPDTEGANYLQQTIIGAKYVSEVIYGGNPPDYLKPILAEPEARQEEIAKLMNGGDWQKASETLANLPFNLQFRETPVEAMLRVLLNQKVNKIRLLENQYSWTNARSSDGDLVCFGDAADDGAAVDGWDPLVASDFLGFFLSRSEIVDCGL